MALKKDIISPIVTKVFGLNGNLLSAATSIANYPSAYIRVEQVVVKKTEQSARVCTYTARDGILLDTEEILGLPVDITGANNIAQAYQAIKALAKFADSEDV
jgi:hypothetical protein